MKTLDLNLKNCYGIKRLKHHFDFTNNRTQIVYAPNGAMKSSLAMVFNDLSQGLSPQDRIFPERKTECKIMVDNKKDINPEEIFVIESYNEEFDSEKMTTLLANEKLRKQFEKIYKTIDSKKGKFLFELSQQAGYIKDIEIDFTRSFVQGDFFRSIELVAQRFEKPIDFDYSSIKYKQIFNDKVLTLIQDKNFLTLIKDYVQKYNELIDKSLYFRKGLFNHTNALDITKNLKKNMFFKAKHSITLNGASENKLIQTDTEFTNFIECEKKKIFSNPELQKKFEVIDQIITKNQELKDFRKLIENNVELIRELINLEEFQRKVWVSYIIKNKDLLLDILDLFTKSKSQMADIIIEAKKESSDWFKVVEIFNDRFLVPFTMTIQNQEEVILKNGVPSIVFNYIDGVDKAVIGRDELYSFLSTGEKRALYLLNILFEIEARKKMNQQTLLVIDDIADSFDYKNKYAIVEYLKEISENGLFTMIIMTHNFDFNRTIHSRLSIPRQNCFMSVKNDSEIKLDEARYLNNAFSYWKQNMHRDLKMFIASISFVRNLIEYTDSTDSKDYDLLTSLVHIKPNTYDITIKDLEPVFNHYLNLSLNLNLNNSKIIDLIYKLADECSCAVDQIICLENKVILSIAIRLKAEEFMIKKINNPSVVRNISSNQTSELIKKFEIYAKSSKSIIDTLKKVNLITPENIHLNSFMYEPILDISEEHLKKLYSEIKDLT